MIFNDLLKKNYNNNKEKYNKINFSIDSYLINTFKGDDYTTNIKYKFFYEKNILQHKYNFKNKCESIQSTVCTSLLLKIHINLHFPC